MNATVRGNHTSRKFACDCIVKLLPGIPEFEQEGVDIVNVTSIGSGQFGTVKLAKIKKLNLTVAAKEFHRTPTKEVFLSEVITLLTLSGHGCFPFCFGILKPNIILMEFIGSYSQDNIVVAPNLSQRVRNGVENGTLKALSISCLNAVIYMHSKKILHNDIKADNFVCASDTTIKLIDFGKATMAAHPVTYNIVKGTQEYEQYNNHHRHLAYELRNLPGSTQNYKTDIFSVGYMFKHIGGFNSYKLLLEIGRLMKRENLGSRISLSNSLDKLLDF